MDDNNSKKEILNTIIQKANKCSKSTFKKTGKFLESVLSSNKELLKELCVQGLPDDLPALRSLIWKICLNYLSINSEEWTDTLNEKRKLYDYYKNLFKNKLDNEFILLENYDKKTKEEKINLDNKTNKKILEDIVKDINRTRQNFSFFFQPVEKNITLSTQELNDILENRRNCSMNNIKDTYKINITETHADVLSRILFIFSQFAPDVGYAQGMNEILAPIYYIFSSDYEYTNNYAQIEADCFWTFFNLMQKIKCVYISEEEHTQSGIYSKSIILKKLLCIFDNQLYTHLEHFLVDYSFFACRWFILFFAQDFLLVDLLRLWDFIFSEEDLFFNIYFLALSILHIKRDFLLLENFGGIISLLQDISDIQIDDLISNAINIKNQYVNQFINIIND